MENLRKDQHVLKDVEFREQPDNADFHRLMEMASSQKGVYQMQNIVKHSEYKRANTARLLKEELDVLSQQRRGIEQKMPQMLEEQHFHDGSNCAVKQQVPILDEVHKDESMCLSKKSDKTSHNQELKIDAEYESISYWKERAMHFEKAFDASLQRERSLEEKLEGFINNLQDTSLDDFSGKLKRLDYFLHFVLRSAPIVIAHQVFFICFYSCYSLISYQ